MKRAAQVQAIAQLCNWTADKAARCLKDLDTLREAELLLEPNDQVFYIAELWGVLGLASESFAAEARDNDYYFRIATATVDQRREALLRVRGKWTQ